MKPLIKTNVFPNTILKSSARRGKTHKKYLAETNNRRGGRGDRERQNMSKVSNNLSILLQSEKVGSNNDF